MQPYEWLNDDSRTFLSRGYVRPGQTAEERIEEIAKHAGKILDSQVVGDWGFFDVQKFIDYTSRGFYSFSSPVWANFGAGRALPIACNGSLISDQMSSIFAKVSEVGMMTKHGAGTSAYFGLIRPSGSPITDGGSASGPVSFIELFESVIRTTSQSGVRRGNFVAYLDIDHPDVMDFLELREEHSRVQDVSIGLCVSDDFMERMLAKEPEAMKVWGRVLRKRFESGYPYIFFSDTVNRNKPQWYKDQLHIIFASNLCSEVSLPSSNTESFVCCLASMNVAQYDEWKDTEAVEYLTYFLDAVNEEYARLTADITYMECPSLFARRHRALGIGVLGWHSYLQQNMIPFESFEAMRLNNEIFRLIDEKTLKASQFLAQELGESEVTRGYGVRNATRTAIAPTTSSSFILGQISPSVEPLHSNYFVKDLAKGKFTYRNPELVKLLERQSQNTEEVWRSILLKGGSVQHLEFLSDHEKAVFRTFGEISQLTIIQQAAQRQKYIDQSQSINLMIHPKTPVKDVNALMIEAWKLGVKTLYYQRGTNPAQELGNSLMACKACEG